MLSSDKGRPVHSSRYSNMNETIGIHEIRYKLDLNKLVHEINFLIPFTPFLFSHSFIMFSNQRRQIRNKKKLTVASLIKYCPAIIHQPDYSDKSQRNNPKSFTNISPN